jgi:DNA-directed RNA polymerase subunit RPC12/RpoP
VTGTGKARIGANGEIIYYHDYEEFLYKCLQCGNGTVRTCKATEEQLHCFECGARLTKLYKGRACTTGCETFKSGNCPVPEDIDGMR